MTQPKNIVMLFDGTNNAFGSANTNVVRLLSMLERSTETAQVFSYQTGVGTMGAPYGLSKWKRMLMLAVDKATAWLLPTHVLNGYRYLQRYYNPGDKIYLFGYSRGAYTARVLAGMIYKVGLIQRGNESLTHLAWSIYRNERDYSISGGFRKTFSYRNVDIEMLGAFDTVSSFGWAWNPSALPYTARNPLIKHFRHAIALDERRVSFGENLWGGAGSTTKKLGDQDIKQVWFAGAHADVGGGTKRVSKGEPVASLISLRWMLGEAAAAGLILDAKAVKESLCGIEGVDTAPLHESLKGWWRLLEYVPMPKRVRKPNGEFVTRWMMHLGRQRNCPAGAMIHESVATRIQKNGYPASRLPPDVEWVKDQPLCPCQNAVPALLAA